MNVAHLPARTLLTEAALRTEAQRALQGDDPLATIYAPLSDRRVTAAAVLKDGLDNDDNLVELFGLLAELSVGGNLRARVLLSTVAAQWARSQT
jgi:hypothetical protein